MEKELIKRNFNVASFEQLETSGEMLKGGFSSAYAGGVLVDMAVNIGSQCGCTVNNVAGCGCNITLPPK